jgi:hypothetical protein
MIKCKVNKLNSADSNLRGIKDMYLDYFKSIVNSPDHTLLEFHSLILMIGRLIERIVGIHWM